MSVSAGVSVIMLGLWSLAAAPARLAVPTDQPTIQAAIDAAQSGDTVFVAAGTYAESLHFKAGIALEGENRDKVTVTCDAYAGPVLLVKDCASGAIKGITFKQTGRKAAPAEKAEALSACIIEFSTVTLADCAAQGSAASGILVQGPNAAPTLTGNICSGNNYHGIYFGEGASGAATENQCSENGGSGIVVEGKAASPELTQNTCVKNTFNGIYYGKEGGGTAKANTCTNNGRSGIIVETTGRPTLLNNVLEDNTRYGLWIDDKAQCGEIKGNHYTHNAMISYTELQYLLYGDDFASLETIGARLRDQKVRYPSGEWQLNSFYEGLTNRCDGMGAASEADYLDRFNKWKAAYPDSTLRTIALACAYHQLGWRDRGGGWASGVTREGWEGFYKYLNLSRDALKPVIDKNVKDPEAYCLLFDLAAEMSSSKPRATGLTAYSFIKLLWNLATDDSPDLKAIFEQGQQIEPLYFPLYYKRVKNLLPRWGGSTSAEVAFAEKAAKDTQALLGDGMYAVIATEVSRWESSDDLIDEYNFSWPRIRQGSLDLLAKFPTSSFRRSHLCKWAGLYQDQATAKTAFAELDDEVDLSVWRNRYQFDAWKKWANGEGPLPGSDPLETAIRDQDTAKVEKLLAGGADVKHIDELGDSLLMAAISAEDIPLAETLFKAGADINYQNPAGETALYRSVSMTSPAFMTFCLENGAKPNVTGREGWTPLLLTLWQNRPERAMQLIEHGADPNLAMTNGWAPLHAATEKRYQDVIVALLARGANADVNYNHGATPLLHAVVNKDISAARVLLEHGADPNLGKENDAWNPVFQAADVGSLELMQLLVEHGGNVMTVQNDGWSIFHNAIQKDAGHVFRFLVETNPKGLDLVTAGGRTLLHQAAKSGRIDIARFLLDRGADPNARETESGLTALGLAKAGGHQEVVALLQSRGAKE